MMKQRNPVCSFGLLIFFLVLTACQTSGGDEDSGRVYLTGNGIAKYHVYKTVRKCKTAFGLDPEAFDMRVTAVSSQIAKKFPKMGKVGRRQGPYDPSARCIKVKRQGTDRSLVVRAIDICCGDDLNNANSHQLDLSEEAFEFLGPKALGNLKVSWAVVDCPQSLQVDSDSDLCDDDYYFSK